MIGVNNMHEDYLSDKLSNIEPEALKDIAAYWEQPDDVIDMSGASHDNDGNEYPDTDR